MSSNTDQEVGGETPIVVTDDNLILNYVAEHVSKKQCILFLGSAIHAPSSKASYQYPKAKSPPIGNELSRYLAGLSQYAAAFPGHDVDNLLRTSQYYESQYQRPLLIQEIEKLVHTDKEPSPVLGALARLEFPIVITTNYDHLYERALDAAIEEGSVAAREYTVSVYSPEKNVKTVDCAARQTHERPFILKIHGDISRTRSIVITDEDYIHFILRMSDKDPYHPVGKNIRAHFAQWPTLFIGYSLKDYNLRVLFKTLRWKTDPRQIPPPTYSVDRNPDKLIFDVWGEQHRYVKFIVEDLWDFIPRLYRKVRQQDMP